jgi:hypothetical protein
LNTRRLSQFTLRERQAIAKLFGFDPQHPEFSVFLTDLEDAIAACIAIRATTHGKRPCGRQPNTQRDELTCKVADLYVDAFCGAWRIQGMEAEAIPLSLHRSGLFARLLKIVLTKAGFTLPSNLRNVTEAVGKNSGLPDEFLFSTERIALMEDNGDRSEPVIRILCDWTGCRRYATGRSDPEISAKWQRRGGICKHGKWYCARHAFWIR